MSACFSSVKWGRGQKRQICGGNGGGSGIDEETSVAYAFLNWKSPQTEWAHCTHTFTLQLESVLGWRRRPRKEQNPEVSWKTKISPCSQSLDCKNIYILTQRSICPHTEMEHWDWEWECSDSVFIVWGSGVSVVPFFTKAVELTFHLTSSLMWMPRNLKLTPSAPPIPLFSEAGVPLYVVWSLWWSLYSWGLSLRKVLKVKSISLLSSNTKRKKVTRIKQEWEPKQEDKRSHWGTVSVVLN